MRNMHRTKPTAVIAVSALMGLVISLSATAAAGPNVISGQSVGAYRLGGYVEARRQFGGPYSSTQSPTSCIARWPNGVSIAWQRHLPYSAWEKACIVFRWAKVTGKAWRTDKGLSIGSTEATLKKLYPSARSKRSNAFTVWSLATSPKSTLQAWSRGGRVVSLWLTG
jgi:hypothetical protein